MNMVEFPSSHNNDPSLASLCLNRKEPSFAGPNFASPSQTRNLSPIITSNKAQLRSRSNNDDDEIGVFRAEKYFNGSIDSDDASSRSSATTRSSCHGHPLHRTEEPKAPTALNVEQLRAKIQPRTPSSVRSGSSWNSRSVLLQNNSSKSKKPVNGGKGFLSSLGCSCSDKNSVETKHAGEISFNKSSTINDNTDRAYKSPLGRHNARSPSTLSIDRNTMKGHKPPRGDAPSFRSPHKSGPLTTQCKSPEVFGSKAVGKTMSLERRLTKMPWSHSPMRQHDEMAVFKSAAADSGSDGSSDLFEIDSLTGKTNPFLAGRRNSDELSGGCATPTTGYAPSEASIQWSVVTASAADFDDSALRARAEAAAQVQQQRRRASALLGCKSHKAVHVASGDECHVAGPRRPPPGYERFRGESPARFQAEIITKMSDGGFSARVGQEQRGGHVPRLASPSPRSTHSHLLYIQ